MFKQTRLTQNNLTQGFNRGKHEEKIETVGEV